MSDGGEYRTPPANHEAEQALLGAILVNNAAFKRVSGFLKPEHFAEGIHGRIFAAIDTLLARGNIATPVTLKNLFDQDGALGEIGGAQYLARLAGSAVTIINSEDYGRTIHDLFLRRQLITLGEDVVNAAYKHDLEHNAETLVFDTRGKLDALADDSSGSGFLPRIEPASLADAEVPTRHWIVDGIIPSRQTTMLAGNGGNGKTLIAMQLAVSRALARDWIELPTTPGRTVIVACEDDKDEIHIRLDTIAREYGTTLAALGDVLIFEGVTHECQLLEFLDSYDKGKPTPFFHKLVAEAKRFGADLLILDSLHNFFSGNENSRLQANRFVAALTSIARTINGAVVLNSHPSQAGRSSGTGESGSTGWDATVRSRIYLNSPKEKDDDPDTDYRELTIKKANYGPRTKFCLRWHRGILVRDHTGEAPIGVVSMIDFDNKVLAEMQKMIGEGAELSADQNARSAFVNVVRKRPNFKTSSLATLVASQGRLLGDKRAVIVTLGTRTRPISRIRPAGVQYAKEKMVAPTLNLNSGNGHATT